MAAVDYPFHVLPADFLPLLRHRHTGCNLHHIHGFTPIGCIVADQHHSPVSNRHIHTLCRPFHYRHNFFRKQTPKINFKAPGTNRCRNFLRSSGRGSHQSKIRWKPIGKNVVNMTWYFFVIFAVIGTFQQNLAVLQHFQQFIHLHRV